ncbi:ATP-binding SpoIIE family protein phosphatase [Streptomyces sp. ICBB 8177]|uniref:ATP-binding SpoIIE family protein phosphatase n=1 Tax=Streptomyces sp. ICBB 8177 TaxID=563922 RepID=UPI000D67E0B6|nr:ATP-binding SpoIIE family protein phosphatase [Streptomyces sp. ICBB 8177]PWI45091.1 phosphatase [Streptomyces sp. ICBB 8177]
MTGVWHVPVHDSTRIRDARVAAECAAAAAALGEARTASAALVATELATNVLKHGGGGQVLIEVVPHTQSGGPADTIQILALDHGPGIADPHAAFRDGYSTAASLGVGLGACLRAATAFDLHSRPGHGTIALARVGPQRPAHADQGGALTVRAAGVHLSLDAAPQSGDAFTHVTVDQKITMMVADGLGHGSRAAQASDAAVACVHQHPDTPPSQLLPILDTALRGTRGAAIALAQVDLHTGTLTFAGTGNIGARLRTGPRWDHLLSRPGIIGAYQHATTPPLQRRPWGPDSMLVLHSDGVPSRWQYPDDPGLPQHDPAVIAAAILRDALNPATPLRDDTTIAVLTNNPHRPHGAQP